jgi:hypothetical protein
VRAAILVAQDNLESLPSEAAGAGKPRGASRIFSAVRTIIIGGIPSAVLIALRYAGLDLSPAFKNWAIVGVILWAVVTLLSLFDPLYATKIKTMGDLISAFRGKDSGS